MRSGGAVVQLLNQYPSCPVSCPLHTGPPIPRPLAEPPSAGTESCVDAWHLDGKGAGGGLRAGAVPRAGDGRPLPRPEQPAAGLGTAVHAIPEGKEPSSQGLCVAASRGQLH